MAQTQEDLARLVVSLEARLTAFDKAMANAVRTGDDTASKIERRFRAAESNLSKFGRTIGFDLKSIVAGLSTGALTAFIGRAVKGMADISDNAKRAGLDVANFQKIVFAARQEGGSQDAIIQGFAKLNVELGKAGEKGNALGKVFRDNNISIAEMQGDPVKAMLTLADLMKNAATATDRATIGTAGLGKNYKELLPFLAQGSDAVKEQMDRFENLGGVIDSKALKAAKELDDQLTAIADVAMPQMEKALGPTIREMLNLIEYAEKYQKILSIGGKDPLGAAADALGANRLHDSLFGPRSSMGPGPSFERSGRGPRPVTKVSPDTTEADKKAAESQKDLARLAREAAKEKKQLATATDTLWAATKREIDEMALEANQANMSIFEFERLKKFKELIARLEDEHRQHGGSVTDQEVRNANALADAYGHMAQAVSDQKNELQQLRDVGDTVFGDLETSLDNFIDTGKLSFSSLVQSILKDMAKLAVHNALGMIQNGVPGTGQTGLMGIFARAFGIGTPPASTAGVLTGTPGVSRNPYDTQRGHGYIPPGAEDIIKQVPLGPVSSAVRVGAAGPTAQWGPFTKDIKEAATAYGLDPNTLAALISKESSFDPTADAHKRFPSSHAFGLTQLEPGTARAMGVTDIHDPTQQIYGGARYLSQQYDRFGNTRDALAAYNQGPGGDLTKGYGYADSIMAQSAKYAQAVTTTAQNAAKAATQSNVIPSAVTQIAQSLGSAGGPGGGGGLGGLLSLFGIGGAGGGSGLSGTRAEGGPVMPGGRYLVGERGPELFMPRIPGVIVPRGGGDNGGGGGFQVHVTPSKYFDVHVSRIAARGDARTLDTAQRNYPTTRARFEKLGTV
jgi:hypothetical protein